MISGMEHSVYLSSGFLFQNEKQIDQWQTVVVMMPIVGGNRLLGFFMEIRMTADIFQVICSVTFLFCHENTA